MNLINALILAGIALAALVFIGLVLTRIYHRTTKGTAFVRTGGSAQKVVMDGGMFVVPMVHNVMAVNLNTMKLEVHRRESDALITKDRMRVDIKADFYVRVKADADAIAKAADTLGEKTQNQNALKDLIEGKFVDALRSVGALMTMEELHEKRAEFVQKVQQTVEQDLGKNGLELETVALTGLDQTSKKFFNPENAFDAQGLRKLTDEIEQRRRERNEIERATQVAIARNDQEAEQKQLEISRELQFAQLEQERAVEARRAAQEAEIAEQRAAARRQAEIAEIAADRAVEEERIAREEAIKNREIARNKSNEIAEQQRAIAVADQSRAESEARAAAEQARGAAVKASEEVETIRETAAAERSKSVELIDAAKRAEQTAIGIRVSATAERAAAEDQAAAAEARARGILAEAEAQAKGKQAINAAENTLSHEQLAARIKLALIQALPSIIEQSVKPMEHIDSIKIVQVDGLRSNGGVTAGGEVVGGGGNLADQMVQAGLRYRAQAPLVDSILKDVGIASNGLGELLAGGINGAGAAPAASPPPADDTTAD